MNAHKKEKRPLKPCVTQEQLLAFDPARPETRTPSPLLNEVLTAMREVCPLSATTLGEHMCVDHKKLAGAVELITGMPFAEMRELWAKHWYTILKERHPKWTQDQLAQALGYADHTSLWNIFNRQKRRTAYLKKKAHSKYIKSLTPEQRDAHYKHQEELRQQQMKKWEEQLKAERERRNQEIEKLIKQNQNNKYE